MRPLRLRAARYPITVVRDEAGVPHITAESRQGALYGLGYLHALDRGTQLLFSRSVASGRAAEQITDKPELLETDRFFRRMGLHLRLEDEVHEFDDGVIEQLEAYCVGVNDGLLGSGRTLPMWATRFRKTPWEPASVLLIGRLLSFGGLAIGQLQNERLIMELIHAGVHQDALRELFSDRMRGVDLDVLRRVHLSNRLSDEALELMTDLPRLAGSNAWAVAPSRSETGGALLAADPHLEVNRLPAIWYEAVVRWPDHYVLGATLPGCPLFAVARTPRLAWGVTYMKGDTVDSFIEDCRPGEDGTWLYRRDDQWHAFASRDESIGRKGRDPEGMQVLENENAVLETEFEEMTEGLHLATAWAGRMPGGGQALSTWLEVLNAHETSEAMEIVKHCPQPTLCWVFADREGHIGLQGCGRIPWRGGGHVGTVPIPAWDPANHWQGWVPLDRLPRLLDPPQGFVATANEEWDRGPGPPLHSLPLPDYRKRRIDSLLAEGSFSVEQMQAFQYDVFSCQARRLLDELLPFVESESVRERLEAWDCRYAPECRGAAFFQRWYQFLMMEALGSQRGIGWRRMLYLCSRAGFSTMILTAADRLLLDGSAGWWRGLDRAQVVRRASERLESELDSRRTWADVNHFHFADRFFGAHRVGRLLGYKSRRIAMPGNHATPFQGHVVQTARRESTFAPSYHFVTDLSQDEAWTNLPGGPSESRFSRWYKSDVERWRTGSYKRLSPREE